VVIFVFGLAAAKKVKKEGKNEGKNACHIRFSVLWYTVRHPWWMIPGLLGPRKRYCSRRFL
jgi:hypothetical protein